MWRHYSHQAQTLRFDAAPTQGSPEPDFSGFDEHKRPDFVQFQHIVGVGGQQTRLER